MAIIAAHIVFHSNISVYAKNEKINFGRLHILSGAGYADDYNTYSIIHWLPMSDFHKSGMSLKIWNKVIGKKNTQSNIQIGAYIGYRFVNSNYKWAFFVGPAWSKKFIIPSGQTQQAYFKEKTHISVELKGESKIYKNWNIIADAQYNAAIREWWIQAKPHYKKNSGIRIGAITQIKQGYGDDNKKYREWAIGAFLSDINIPWFLQKQSLWIGAEIMAQKNFKEKKIKPYIAVNIGVLF